MTVVDVDDAEMGIHRIYADWHVMIYGPSLTMDMLLASNGRLLEDLHNTVGVKHGVRFRCDEWLETKEPGLCLHIDGSTINLPLSMDRDLNLPRHPLMEEELEFGLRYHLPPISSLLDRAMQLEGMAAEVAVLSDLGEKVTYHGNAAMAMRLKTTLDIASTGSAALPDLQEEIPLSSLFVSKEK